MPIKDPEERRKYDREYKRKQRSKDKGPSRSPFCYVTKAGKVVRQDILDQYAVKEKEGSQQLPVDKFGGQYQQDKLVQPLYNPETLAGITEINAYHARCCQTKARDIAGLGFIMSPLVENPSEEQKFKLEDFMDKQMNFSDTCYRHQYDIEVVSYGAFEVVREGNSHDGVVERIYHIPSHTLRIHSEGNKVQQRRGNKKRWFKIFGYDKDVHYETGIEHEFGALPENDRATEIIWNSLYSQRSDFYGTPDIVPALGAVHGDASRRDYNLNFFENFGVPAYAVFITGDYDPGPYDEDEERYELERTIEEHMQALAENPHSTLVLTIPSREGGTSGVDVRFQPLAVDVKDASFRLYRKDNRDEVIIAHGVPPYRIGVVETGSLGGSTARESTKIYKSSVVKPRQNILESLLNDYIVRGSLEITDWELRFIELDTEDEGHDIKMVTELFGIGVMRIRDVIQLYGKRFGLEDDPDDPTLDLRFVSGKPINAEVDVSGEAMLAMQSLQKKLLEVAIKYDGSYSEGLERVTHGLGDRKDPAETPGSKAISG